MPVNSLNETADSIIKCVNQRLKEKENIVVAIDGRCASGKTTLAKVLQERLSCVVIHMDDFFLRPEQRTQKRLAEPGGNVDKERILEEVIKPLKRREDFSYCPYDCHTQSFKTPVQVKRNPVTIIEGSYSAHPYLWENYDLHIFLDVDKETQYKRICARNGEEMAERFTNLWIPLEETYFSAFGIKEKCALKYSI